jgi:hypothetical protein
MFAMTITTTSISLVLDGKPYSINQNHPRYFEIREAAKTRDVDTLRKLVDVNKLVEDYSNGLFAIKDSKVLYDGQVTESAISARIIRMIQEGFEITPMINFLNNLMENPSKNAVSDLYRFLEHNELPITDDGHFLAYKKVKPDYTDFHSGKFDNSIGKVVEERRNLVDEDNNRTCSTGLHFCSLSYLPNYASNDNYRVVIVKVHPKDVVAVPRDYDNAKVRCCKYEVVGEHSSQFTEKFNKPVCGNSGEDDSQFKAASGNAPSPSDIAQLTGLSIEDVVKQADLGTLMRWSVSCPGRLRLTKAGRELWKK